MIELSDIFFDPNDQVAQSCNGDSRSAFVVTGHGGLLPDPTERIESSRLWIDLREISSLSPNSAVLSTDLDSQTTRILEANS